MTFHEFQMSVKLSLARVFASLGLGHPHFQVRFSGFVHPLPFLGRRLEALAPGTRGRVEVEVDDASADLQRAADSGVLAEEVEDSIEGADVKVAHAGTQLNSEPGKGYKSSGWGTVCRSDSHDLSTNAYGKAYVVEGLKSVLQCSDVCTAKGDNCHGFEYRKTVGRCEIHPATICHTPPQNKEWFADTPSDFQCFTKTCP